MASAVLQRVLPRGASIHERSMQHQDQEGSLRGNSGYPKARMLIEVAQLAKVSPM